MPRRRRRRSRARGRRGSSSSGTSGTAGTASTSGTCGTAGTPAPGRRRTVRRGCGCRLVALHLAAHAVDGTDGSPRLSRRVGRTRPGAEPDAGGLLHLGQCDHRVGQVDPPHPQRRRGRHVAGMVVDEDRTPERDAEALADQLVDPRVGFAQADLARVDDHVEQLERHPRLPTLPEGDRVVRADGDPVAGLLQAHRLVDHRPEHPHPAAEAGGEGLRHRQSLADDLHRARGDPLAVLLERDLVDLESLPAVGVGRTGLGLGLVEPEPQQLHQRAGRQPEHLVATCHPLVGRCREHPAVVEHDRVVGPHARLRGHRSATFHHGALVVDAQDLGRRALRQVGGDRLRLVVRAHGGDRRSGARQPPHHAPPSSAASIASREADAARKRRSWCSRSAVATRNASASPAASAATSSAARPTLKTASSNGDVTAELRCATRRSRW